MTDRLLCRVCDARGFVYGGERGETYEPCPECSPSESVVNELERRAGAPALELQRDSIVFGVVWSELAVEFHFWPFTITRNRRR